MTRVFGVFAAIANVLYLLGGCASVPPPTLKPRAESGQVEAFRGGKTFISSRKARSFVMLSVVPETLTDNTPSSIMVTVLNDGTDPLDIKLSDFTFSTGDLPVKLATKQEVLAALRSQQQWRAVMLALAGGIEAGQANMAAKNSSFTGSASTEYRANDGRSLGTSQSSVQGAYSNPAAAQQAANEATDRAASDIARVRAEGRSASMSADSLMLERETLYPGKNVTFMLVPQRPKRGNTPEVVYILRAAIGEDRHQFSIVERAGQ